MPIPFRPIARMLARTVEPPPELDLSGIQDLLHPSHQDEGVLLTVNHYSDATFHAWWFVILISAIFPAEIHWVVTSGWTNSGWLNGFTHWLFPLGADLLGFTAMPAMPPKPAEAELRAVAVRQVLTYTAQAPRPIVGLAPQGGDTSGGVLGSLPPGVGRFMGLLSQHCPKVLPVGVWKQDGIIRLRFGHPYRLDLPPGLSSTSMDQLVGNTVMRHIAALLPEALRGDYQ